MTENSKLTLSTGLELVFAGIMAGDLIDAVAELGTSLEDADPFKSSLTLAWRSAVRGGFKGSFREFVDQIPMVDVQEVVKSAQPFLFAGPA
jgi:hypothetical protein